MNTCRYDLEMARLKDLQGKLEEDIRIDQSVLDDCREQVQLLQLPIGQSDFRILGCLLVLGPAGDAYELWAVVFSLLLI